MASSSTTQARTVTLDIDRGLVNQLHGHSTRHSRDRETNRQPDKSDAPATKSKYFIPIPANPKQARTYGPTVNPFSAGLKASRSRTINERQTVTNVSSYTQPYQQNGSKRRRVSVEAPNPLPLTDINSSMKTARPGPSATGRAPVTTIIDDDEDSDPMNLVSSPIRSSGMAKTIFSPQRYPPADAIDAFRSPNDPLSPGRPDSKPRREHDLCGLPPSQRASKSSDSISHHHDSNLKSETPFQIPLGKVTDLTNKFEARTASRSKLETFEMLPSKEGLSGSKKRLEPRTSKMKPKTTGTSASTLVKPSPRLSALFTPPAHENPTRRRLVDIPVSEWIIREGDGASEHVVRHQGKRASAHCATKTLDFELGDIHLTAPFSNLNLIVLCDANGDGIPYVLLVAGTMNNGQPKPPKIRLAIRMDVDHDDWNLATYSKFISVIKQKLIDTRADVEYIMGISAAEALWEGELQDVALCEVDNTSFLSIDDETSRPTVEEAHKLLENDSDSSMPPLPKRKPPRPRRRVAGSTVASTEVLEPQEPILNPDETILVYPSSGPGAVHITNAVLRRLSPGEFLNDTLIEFGLKLWLNHLRDRDPELAESIHVFSPFFYKKLKAGKEAKETYKTVRKWSAKFDLFKKKYIVVPINENVHWFLAIICNPEYVLRTPLPESPRKVQKRKTRQSKGQKDDSVDIETDELSYPRETDELNYPRETEDVIMNIDSSEFDRKCSIKLDDAEDGELQYPGSNMEVLAASTSAVIPPTTADAHDRSVTHIFTLDSMGSRHPSVGKVLAQYLEEEAEDKKNFKPVRAPQYTRAHVPSQPNFCDCGVYLLHFAETFMSNPTRYMQIILSGRKPPAPEIREDWKDDVVAGLRNELLTEIRKLSIQWKGAGETQSEATANEPSEVLAAHRDPSIPCPTSDQEVEDLIPSDATEDKTSKDRLLTPLTPEPDDEDIIILDTPKPRKAAKAARMRG